MDSFLKQDKVIDLAICSFCRELIAAKGLRRQLLKEPIYANGHPISNRQSFIRCPQFSYRRALRCLRRMCEVESQIFLREGDEPPKELIYARRFDSGNLTTSPDMFDLSSVFGKDAPYIRIKDRFREKPAQKHIKRDQTRTRTLTIPNSTRVRTAALSPARGQTSGLTPRFVWKSARERAWEKAGEATTTRSFDIGLNRSCFGDSQVSLYGDSGSPRKWIIFRKRELTEDELETGIFHPDFASVVQSFAVAEPSDETKTRAFIRSARRETASIWDPRRNGGICGPLAGTDYVVLPSLDSPRMHRIRDKETGELSR
jgi:hypothetical protein